MTQQKKTLIHGTAVAIQGKDFPAAAVLLRGFAGSGKSDLAFRLIAAGATLICGEQVALEIRQDKVLAENGEGAPGLLEVKGVGLIKFPVAKPTPLQLIVDLVPREEVPHLPPRKTVDILGVPVVALKLHAFDASTPFKIIKAIELVHKPDLLV